jgi:hypothetical protein
MIEELKSMQGSPRKNNQTADQGEPSGRTG